MAGGGAGMTTFTLYIDDSSTASTTEVVGPSGPSGSATIDDDYTASNRAIIDADTSGGAFTITLPATGGTVAIRDMDDTWATNTLTVDGNAATIDGEDTIDMSGLAGFAVTFTRRSADTEWRYTFTYIYGA